MFNLKVNSPSKINVFLHVTGKREDGYHELFSLMTCLDLCDDIEFNFNQTKISVLCNHPDVPEDESNLAHKAATTFFDKLVLPSGQTHKKGVLIKISKIIPVGGGLGGGSSNAACVLKTMNKVFNYPFSKSQLMSMGLELGTDVPFFIDGGPAFVQGIGEKLSKPISLLPYYALILSPSINASTINVYKNIDLALTNESKYNINPFLKAHEKGMAFDVKKYLHNDLELSACSLYPELALFKEQITEILPKKVLMTGSGASFFALFSDFGSAKHCFHDLSIKWHGTDKKVFLTFFVNFKEL